MITLLALLSLFVQAALLYVAYEVLQELRRSSARQSSQTQVQANPSPGMRPLTALSVVCYGDNAAMRRLSSIYLKPHCVYVIWVWRGDCWELDQGTVPAGAEPGSPPLFNGTFDGHRVKVQCIWR